MLSDWPVGVWSSSSDLTVLILDAPDMPLCVLNHRAPTRQTGQRHFKHSIHDSSNEKLKYFALSFLDSLFPKWLWWKWFILLWWRKANLGHSGWVTSLCWDSHQRDTVNQNPQVSAQCQLQFWDLGPFVCTWFFIFGCRVYRVLWGLTVYMHGSTCLKK